LGDLSRLPPDLPVPEDDSAADGLEGRAVPGVWLAATSDEPVDLEAAARGCIAHREGHWAQAADDALRRPACEGR
jgi:hypothetical protein